MKINVTLSIEVDPEAWADTYGITKAEVRGDVRQYIETQIQGCSAVEEFLFTSVSTK
jgi:hypothetical protein